jgi:2-methylisocitrate lyase-like PEP mutase family enzyme
MLGERLADMLSFQLARTLCNLLAIFSAVKHLTAALQLGADAALLEVIESKKRGRQACLDLAPTPVVLNLVEGGSTPHISSPKT